MKTIMIFINSSGALYDFRNELVLRLLQEYRVVACVPDTVKTDLLEQEGVEVVSTPINRRGVNPFQDLRLLSLCKKLIRRYRPSLALTYTIKPNVYAGMACSALKIPYIPTITGLGSAFEKKGLFLWLIQSLYRRGIAKASCVFFQNEENRERFLEAGLTSGRTRLVAGSGVNLVKNNAEPYPEDGITRFLYVGRMMKEKGTEELLAAAEQLHSENVHFFLMGYCDDDYQQLLDEKEKEGVITQLGFHKEVHEYYKKASAVVLPTYHEGMANVLMEASATARPVIATNISGCREIVEDGVTGFCFAPKSAEALVAALKKFLALTRAERASMGAAARAKMEREFDRDKVVDAYMEEIEDAVQG